VHANAVAHGKPIPPKARAPAETLVLTMPIICLPADGRADQMWHLAKRSP
jgi:hypothetical protein